MKIFLSRRAKQALNDSAPDVRERLEAKISELLTTPYPKGCKKLKGAPNSYRLRAGDYRVIYVILKEDEILVFKIALRESVYE